MSRQARYTRIGQPRTRALWARAIVAALICCACAACRTPPPPAAAMLLPSAEVRLPAMARAIPAGPLRWATTTSSPRSLAPTAAVASDTPAPPTAPATPSGVPTAADPPPTACPAPAGWAPYSIQPNDTLFELALRTGSTIEQIQAANCLGGTTLLAGQSIILPAISPPTATNTNTPLPTNTPILDRSSPTNPPPTATRRPNHTTPQPPTATRRPDDAPATATREPTPTNLPCSVFSCANGDLPDLSLPTGGPDDPSFIPCHAPRFDEHGQPTPYIDTPDTAVVQLGQHFFLYLCDLTDADLGAALTATMQLADGTQQHVDLLPDVPNLDLSRGGAKYVVDWPALPTQPLGIYTLTVEGASAPIPPKPFGVEAPSTQYILPVRLSGPPGTEFEIYYVNFSIGTQPTIEFYRQDTPTRAGEHIFAHIGRWQIPIAHSMSHDDTKGWAVATLKSAGGDPATTYALGFDNVRVFSYIWLR